MEKTNKFVDPDDRLYSPPPQKTRLQAFRTFLYNPQEGSFLGRTCSSWAKIITFYMIYYSCLVAFFAVCMWGLLQTIDENEPKFQLDSSIIGSSPGLSSRPIPEAGREAVLYYSNSTAKWSGSETMLLDEFLQEYQTNTSANPCDYTDHTVPCEVKMSDWGTCIDGNQLNAPCMFFKLNKVYGWSGQYYKDNSNLPSGMPDQLREVIEKTTGPMRQKVWLSCQGQHPEDKENLGDVEYYPEQGFPNYYYPFKRQEGFRSPVVAVHFANAKSDVEITVECRSWGPNMVQDRKEQLGVLNFKIKIN